MAVGMYDGVTTVTAFRRAGIDPVVDQATGGFETRQGQYRYYWYLYSNSIFDELIKWVSYKQRYRLYRQARSVYNPFRRLVDSYSGTIYGGVITEDGLPLPDGTPSAIPLDPSTDERLRTAAVQVWRWSNMQANKSLYARFGSALGDVFMEVVDDLERQKVWLQVWWPGFVSDLQLDPQGNVVSYALEYEVRPPRTATGALMDPAERPYIYRKEVDGSTIRYFRDGKPWDYGQGQIIEHFYGFAPAVWVNHQSLGSIHGANAWEGSQSKLEELNGLVSRIHDQIHKSVASPRIFWTNSRITSLLNQAKRGSEEVDEVSAPDAERESVMLLKGPLDGRTESLLGELDIASSLPYIQELMKEIEADHPELNMWKELREMQQVSGPGATRLIGDTLPKYYEAAANYDRGLVAATQMAIAIAGDRIRAGEWGTQTLDPTDEGTTLGLSRHQQAFAPFDLTSWDKGDLDMIILPRQVLPLTIDEKLAHAMLKQNLGVDGDTILKEIGYAPDQLAIIKRNRKREKAESLAQQQAMFSAGQDAGAFAPAGAPE